VLESNSQYREFVQQQVKTINRFDIVFAALQKLGDKRFLWQNRKEPDRIAAERLQGTLEIKPVPDTYQITVGLEGKKSEGLAEVVNAVVESYLAELRKGCEAYRVEYVLMDTTKPLEVRLTEYLVRRLQMGKR
jgi:hypothetical protein